MVWDASVGFLLEQGDEDGAHYNVISDKAKTSTAEQQHTLRLVHQKPSKLALDPTTVPLEEQEHMAKLANKEVSKLLSTGHRNVCQIYVHMLALFCLCTLSD